MFLTKRFLIIISGTASLAGFIFYRKGWDSQSALNDLILDDIYKDISPLTKVSINSNIDSNVKDTKSTFLYTLFSTNLDSFTKKLHEHFYAFSLFKWADSFLQEGNKESYLYQKANIYDELVRLKFNYVLPTKDKLTPQNWDRDSYIATQAKNKLEEQFLNVFFSELFLKKNGASEFAFDEEKYRSYGKGSYSHKVSDFQKFIYDEWISRESPFLLCTKDWSYSKTFASNDSFKFSDLKLEKPNFDFPDFKDIESEIIEINKKSYSTKEFCSKTDYKLWTRSSIAELKDGYKASAILWTKNRNESANAKTLSGSSGSDKVLDLFVDSDSSSGSEQVKWNVPQDLLTTTTNKNLFALRDVKFNNNNIGTYSRTLSGLSFYFKNSDHENVREFLLKNYIEQQQQKIGTFDLKDVLKDFFKKNSGELLASYLGKNKNQLFKEEISDNLASLLASTYEFSKQLDKNQNLWKILHSFSQTSERYLNVKWASASDKSTSKEYGLVTPILFKRNLDMSTALVNTEWLNGIKKDNDGSFTELTSKLFEDEKKEELFNKSNDLKKELAKFFNNFEEGENKHYFNDYLLDNIYYDFQKEGKLRKTIRNVSLINKLNFNWFKNELNDYSNKVAQRTELPNNTQEELKEEIKKNVIDVFYGNEYSKEPYADKLNYGGYKYNHINSINSYCTKKIDNGETKKLNVKISLKNCQQAQQNENEKQFRQKLVNYWLTKNYYYHPYGYEISSDLSTKYIYYLYSIYWLTNNQFSNLRAFMLSNIPSNRFGALVWMDRVENSNWKQKQEDSEVVGKNKNTGNNQVEIDNIDMYFKEVNLPDIFSPFASAKITNKDGRDFPLNSEKISAFAKTGDGEFTEFFGFKGFVSETFGDLDKEIKQKIFNNFKIHNPPKNKNYVRSLSLYENEENITGLAFGTVVDQAQDVNTIIDAFGAVDTLKRWVDTYFKTESDILKSWISETEANSPLFSGFNISISQMKEKVKSIFKDGKAYKNATTRFSGFLQGEIKNSPETQKFFISDKDGKGWIIYITQLNRNDFQGGFEKLINEIGIKTLFKMLAMLPNVESGRTKPANQMFLEENLVV